MNDEQRAERVARKLVGPVVQEVFTTPSDTRDILRALAAHGLLEDFQLDPGTVVSRTCYGWRAYEDGLIELIHEPLLG